MFGNRIGGKRNGLSQSSRSCTRSIASICKEPEEGLAIVTALVVPKTGGMNTTKATVVHWLKKEGDSLKQGDPLVELETEKVNYELDSPVEGVLLKIVRREPAEVPVGGLLGYIGKPGDVVPGTPSSS
jgi:pyruvate/2-oxoglutarate dehydrogenase complex dihydrolipoamide acyltransferase (E2) component